MLSYIYRTPAEPSGLAWDVYGSYNGESYIVNANETAPPSMRSTWAETFEIGDNDNQERHNAQWDGWPGSQFLTAQKVVELS